MKSKLLIICFMLCVGVLLCWILYPDKANSGPYLDSAHGSSSYGVYRSGLDSSGFDYSKGNCAHCHEQHAMIGGDEPEPPLSGGPNNYALFYTNYIDQTDNVCFKCHTDSLSVQTGSLINRSYSYRAGGWTDDTLNDILEAFSFTLPGSSSHYLDDILTFITSGSWGYTTDSNPCAACHNPHRAKRDPHISSGRTDVSGNLIVSSVSRPSDYSKDNNAWELWGDETGERMNDYTASYQAPYQFSSTADYEPDGSDTQDGSNLADYVTFCTDCHNNINTILSTPLGDTLRTINWSTEKHGQGNFDDYICVDPPYNATSSCTNTVTSKVLACTDCHEPHGAPNVMLIRKEINGGVLSGTVSSGTKDYGYACRQCHMDDLEYDAVEGTANRWEAVHHCADDYPYIQQGCNAPGNNCHSAPSGGRVVCSSGPGGPGDPVPTPIDCSNCHYHGSSVTDADVDPTTRTTF